MSRRYRLAGVVVDSDLPLRSMPCDGGLPGDLVLRVRIEVSAPRPMQDDGGRARTRLDGTRWLSVAREAGGYFLRVHDHADFRVDLCAATVDCIVPDPGAQASLEPLLLDQILPLVLHALGRFSFHGSAVAFDDREVVAFVGDSGAGKSTLASSLARARPFAFFADDCIAFARAPSRVLAHPGSPSARLWPSSASSLFADRGDLPAVSPRTDKRRVDLAVVPRPLPLGRIYLLEPSSGAPAITPLRPAAALVALLGHVHRLDVDDGRMLGEELAALAHLVGCVAVRRLAYRRSFADLDAVREAITADVVML